MKSLVRSKGLDRKTQDIVNREIKKQVVKMADLSGAHFDSLVLYVLMRTQKWGKHRLRRFYEDYDRAIRELADYYEAAPIGNGGLLETEYYAMAELKRIGVDVELWRSAKSNWSPEADEVWLSTGERGYRFGVKK